jgi:hypothetical protein
LATATFPSGAYIAISVVVADVNGDGKSDIVVANSFGDSNYITNGEVGVLLGNGDGTFQTAATYALGGFVTQSVAVADVNGYGKPDIMTANYCNNSNCTNGTVSVLINTSIPITPPTVTVSAKPTTLWPPNGKMVPVTISGTIIDTVSGVNASTAAYSVIDEYREVQPSGSIILGSGGVIRSPSRLKPLATALTRMVGPIRLR